VKIVEKIHLQKYLNVGIAITKCAMTVPTSVRIALAISVMDVSVIIKKTVNR